MLSVLPSSTNHGIKKKQKNISIFNTSCQLYRTVQCRHKQHQTAKIKHNKKGETPPLWPNCCDNIYRVVLQAANRGHCECIDRILYWWCGGAVKSFISRSLSYLFFLSYKDMFFPSVDLYLFFASFIVSLSFAFDRNSPCISDLCSSLLISVPTCLFMFPSSLFFPMHAALSLPPSLFLPFPLLWSLSVMVQVHNKWEVYYCVLGMFSELTKIGH